MSHALSSVSQLLSRHQALFTDQHIAVCGAIEDIYPLALTQKSKSATIISDNFAQTSLLKSYAPQANIIFDIQLPTSQRVDVILLYMPKAKARAKYWIAQALAMLPEQGTLYVAGENRSGVRSIPAIIQDFGIQTLKLDSARRCSLFAAQKTKAVIPFHLSQWWQHYPLKIADTQLNIWALPGVFSQNHCDPASELLLQHTTSKLTGSVLDFGCGTGVISAVLQQKNPQAQFHLIDVDAFALASSKKTFSENNLQAQIYPSNVFSQVNETFDFIVTNPPFHTGLRTDYSHTQLFLQQAKNFLKKSGELYLVANRFIKYESLMKAHFSSTQKLIENNKYTLYRTHQD